MEKIEPEIREINSSGSESGSKYLSSRDIANFLNGRDVLVARDVDQLCAAVKAAPQDQKEGLAKAFGQAAVMKPRLDINSIGGIALLKTMQKPEFSEIKNIFEKTGSAIRQSLEGLEKENLFDDREAQISFSEKGQVSFSPKLAEVMLCSPGFMDPIMTLKNMPPPSQEVMDRFGRAVHAEENKMFGMDGAHFEKELQDLGQKISPQFLQR